MTSTPLSNVIPFFFVLLTMLVVPYLAWKSKLVVDTGIAIPRFPFYIESILVQTIILACAVGAARSASLAIPVHLVRAREHLALSGVVFVATLVIMAFGWSASPAETRKRILMVVPRSRSERLMWVLVCTAAAIGEEIAYRGALFLILERLTGNWTAAALLSATAFGLAHLIQGWNNVPLAAVFALVFQLLAGITGSLLPGIVIHFLYDLIAGLSLPAIARSDDHS